MNQFFSLHRFNLLVLKHWADNKRRYGLAILALIGVLVAWFLFVMLMSPGNVIPVDIQQSVFFMLLFAVGSFYASQYFSDLGSKIKGSNVVLVPASSFEKLLCSLLYTMVMFVIVFVAVFYIVDFLMVSLSNIIYRPGDANGKSEVANVLEFPVFRRGDSTYNFIFFFFSVQSAFLLGSVYFKKYSFIKTIICGFIAWLIIFSVTLLILRRFLPASNHPAISLEPPAWLPPLAYFLTYITPVFLWIVTYYRLKVKQV